MECGLVAGEVTVHLLSTVEVPFEQGTECLTAPSTSYGQSPVYRLYSLFLFRPVYVEDLTTEWKKVQIFLKKGLIKYIFFFSLSLFQDTASPHVIPK